MNEAHARRTAYQGSVVELHRSGMPMREIAKELGISHQRVHQIVSEEPSRTGRRAKVAGSTVAAIVLTASLGLAIRANLTPTASEAIHAPPVRVVVVPNVVGLPSEQAFRTLGSAGLRPAGVSTAYSTSVPALAVLNQDPEPGTRLRVGSGVNLVESKGARRS